MTSAITRSATQRRFGSVQALGKGGGGLGGHKGTGNRSITGVKDHKVKGSKGKSLLLKGGGTHEGSARSTESCHTSVVKGGRHGGRGYRANDGPALFLTMGVSLAKVPFIKKHSQHHHICVIGDSSTEPPALNCALRLCSSH
ncbi:hypothetical protein EYF80_041843 [Liparis tanakae]|uniref:Uncharacterized protein n=1 Tax=Liparis tanakae TaxID=230148 RepID=A0A4Z2G427_9TELE|nr:hypothetical protein EYF80_041843 [Liparis tanakae]